MPQDKLYIILVSPFRRRARKLERELQDALNGYHYLTEIREHRRLDDEEAIHFLRCNKLLEEWLVPDWARGVKVSRAGVFQHAVVATENRGH